LIFDQDDRFAREVRHAKLQFVCFMESLALASSAVAGSSESSSMNKNLVLVLLFYAIVLFAGHRTAFVASPRTVFQQQSKATLFTQFNDKKRADPKEAYRLAQLYLRRYGQDQDEDTKYVKEWVKAYEAVITRMPAGKTSGDAGATPSARPATPAVTGSPAKNFDVNGTTWQIKGKENGRPWATIFSFRSGGKFQSERYAVDGSSSIAAGTWRQLDESVFATLLGADGIPAGTIRAEVDGACLVVLKASGEVDSMMETDSAPNGCASRREAERRAQEAQRQQAEKVVAAGKAKAATMPATIRNNAGMELVLIQPGRFMIGSGSGGDALQHEVTITQPFYIGRYEVTQAQWQSVMGNNPSGFDKCGGNCPVEMVSWNDAEGFISRLNSQGGDYTYRLPTEAEWDYAALAGTTGDYAGNLDALAWYDQNADGRTHPAGTKQPNAWGLYDMHGNVWEWCQDWYGGYKAAPSADPQGPANGTSRVLRGGSWIDSADLCAFDISLLQPAHSSSTHGFRVVAVERTR
jgi:formylglycine-generating enzyme required for sulfatase activity